MQSNAPLSFFQREGMPTGRGESAVRHTLTLLFLLTTLFANAQLYDAQWALGYNESVIDFRTADTVKIDSLPTFIFYTFTNASICDEQGNLLYYTNGISICGPTDTILNGNDLSPCPYSDAYAYDGLNIPQAVLFLPKPGNSRYYYLFHFSNDALDNSRPGTLYYSEIDKNGNGGLGSVISKNNILLNNTQLREGGMTACKHANGRDYWLIIGKYNTNTFYKFLLGPDFISGPFIQTIGPVFSEPYDVAYSKFSQDGSKFVTGTYESLILVMDFDRCSGNFSNAITLSNIAPPPFDSISGSCSVEFSANDRFVYACDNVNLNQYDLWSDNMQDSTQLFLSDSSDGAQMRMLQMAPNGKIYASTWNGGLPALHVITNPDLKGDSSNFVYAGQPTLTVNSANLPNLINYKLGPLTGSGCDTITAITEIKNENQEPRIIPNPANKYAYVEMGSQGNYRFQLLTPTGQITDQKQTPQVDIFDTENLAAGVYFIKVIDNTTGIEITTKKLVVVH